MTTIGERLRRARERRVWSQADLAREAGVTKLAILRIENGQAQPRPSTLRALAAALGVEPAWLRYGEQEEGQQR